MIEYNEAMAFGRALLQEAFPGREGRLPGGSKEETEKWLSDHLDSIRQRMEKEWKEHVIELDPETVFCHYRDWKILYRMNDYSMEFKLQVGEEDTSAAKFAKKIVFHDIASGDVKWDHCINFSFDTGTMHMCGEEEFAVFPLLWKEIYKLASGMPHWLES